MSIPCVLFLKTGNQLISNWWIPPKMKLYLPILGLLGVHNVGFILIVLHLIYLSLSSPQNIIHEPTFHQPQNAPRFRISQAQHIFGAIGMFHGAVVCRWRFYYRGLKLEDFRSNSESCGFSTQVKINLNVKNWEFSLPPKV